MLSAWLPPRDTGTTWSTWSACPPQYAHTSWSRRSTRARVFAQPMGRCCARVLFAQAGRSCAGQRVPVVTISGHPIAAQTRAVRGTTCPWSCPSASSPASALASCWPKVACRQMFPCSACRPSAHELPGLVVVALLLALDRCALGLRVGLLLAGLVGHLHPSLRRASWLGSAHGSHAQDHVCVDVRPGRLPL